MPGGVAGAQSIMIALYADSFGNTKWINIDFDRLPKGHLCKARKEALFSAKLCSSVCICGT